MELQVSYSVCAKIQAKSILRRKKVRNKRNTTKTVPVERSRNSRRGSVPGSHTYAGKYPAQNERFGVHGVFERKKLVDDISKMG